MVAVCVEGVQFRLPMQELECPQSRRDQFCQIPPHGMPNYMCHCLVCHTAPSLRADTFPPLTDLRNGIFFGVILSWMTWF